MTPLSPSTDRREGVQATERAARPCSLSEGFGGLLKSWRTCRRYSQLDLALEAKVSQRHLSFLESGRARPSREMVLQLAKVLCIPLRERNELLLATGFAPLYQERALDSADMVAIKQALEATLRHHEPYPALAVDRQWNVVLQNAAVDRLVGLLGSPSSVWQMVDPAGQRNLMRLTLHPRGMQPLVRNWQQTATVLLTRLQREVAGNPADVGLRALLSDLCGLPGIPANWRHAMGQATPPPVLAIELGKKATPSLKLFSMVCTFGTAMDVTADELRTELFFPEDEFTAGFFHDASNSTPPRPRLNERAAGSSMRRSSRAGKR